MTIRFQTNPTSSVPITDRTQPPNQAHGNTHSIQPEGRSPRSRESMLQLLSQKSGPSRPAGIAPRRALPGALDASSSADRTASCHTQTQTERRAIDTRTQGYANRRSVTLLNADGAAGLARSIDSAGKAVKRLAKRLAEVARPGTRRATQPTAPSLSQPPQSRPVALNIPRDYGWPLGLMEHQRLEKLPLDQAYEQAFKTHTARVSAAVAQSADERFGHTHIDNDTLRAQLHAWAHAEDGDVDIHHDDVPWKPESDSETDEASSSSESEIQSAHSSPGQPAAATADAGPSRTRRVHFAPEAEARQFHPDSATLSPTVDRFPIHAPDHASVKPKGHAPDSPESQALARQRSINTAAWDTLVRLKSPRFGPEDKKMTADMLKQGQLLFTVKRQHRLPSDAEAAAVQVVRELDRETRKPSFSGKVKGLMRQLRGQGPTPGQIAIPGHDNRYETLQRANKP